MSVELFRTIPNHENYEISKDGIVRNKNNKYVLTLKLDFSFFLPTGKTLFLGLFKPRLKILCYLDKRIGNFTE